MVVDLFEIPKNIYEYQAQFKRCAIIVLNSIDQLSQPQHDDSSMLESTFLLNLTVELSSTSSVTLHDSGVDSNVVLNLCQTQSMQYYDNIYCTYYSSGLVRLYPDSTFQSALSGTPKLNLTFKSTVILKSRHYVVA